ncbi:adenosylhomocysteinase [bacterium]|nr:adenosylhomocysteinase [bacterium]
MIQKGRDVRDPALSKDGEMRVDWAARDMPVLESITARFKRSKPLDGHRIAACLHVTTETANLALALAAGGARVRLCASNPLSTQDEVAAFLAKQKGIEVYAIRGENRTVYYDHLRAALEFKPTITMDDGADLVTLLHTEYTNLIDGVVAGTEETTTGVIRLRALAKAGKLGYPIIAVNDALTKHMFDNRYGTGQSTLDGILRATNLLIAGKNVVVAGYGWCGRGFAMRAHGHGAHVIVTEVDPIKAIEAHMDGFKVMPMDKAAKIGDLFVTLTGDINVIDKQHFAVMKDNAVVCNSGHFDVEINLKALKKMTKGAREIRPNCVERTMPNGRRIIVLAEGRLVNLSAAEGHAPSVMDMSFANQALCAELIAKGRAGSEKIVYPVPEKIDTEVAKLKLKSLGIAIDKLTEEQQEYLASYEIGT